MIDYGVPDRWMLLPDTLMARLQLILEPGRRTYVHKIGTDPHLRAWFAKLDSLAPAGALTAHETVWIPTAEAANILGLTPRRVRDMAGKIRSERHGNVLVFDLADVQEEAEARRTSPTSRAGEAA